MQKYYSTDLYKIDEMVTFIPFHYFPEELLEGDLPSLRKSPVGHVESQFVHLIPVVIPFRMILIPGVYLVGSHMQGGQPGRKSFISVMSQICHLGDHIFIVVGVGLVMGGGNSDSLSGFEQPAVLFGEMLDRYPVLDLPFSGGVVSLWFRDINSLDQGTGLL